MVRMATTACVLLPLLALGSCQTSLRGYQSYELEPVTPSADGGNAPGIPFRLTKPVYFIEATKSAAGAITGYELKVEYVTDPSRVYWVDICPADLQENDFGLSFGASGELTTVSSVGADQSKGWIQTLAAVAKGALGVYVLAEAETPTDIGWGAYSTTSAAVDVLNANFVSADDLDPLFRDEGGAMQTLLAPLAAPGVAEVSLDEVVLEQLKTDAGTDSAGREQMFRDLGLDKNRRALIERLHGMSFVDRARAVKDMTGHLRASLVLRIAEFHTMTSSSTLPTPPKDGDADTWLEYYARLEAAIRPVVAGLSGATREPAKALEARMGALVAMVLRLKRGPAELAVLLDSVVLEASGKPVGSMDGTNPWVIAARELIEPRFSIAERPERSPFWLTEIAERRARIGKVLAKRRDSVLVGMGSSLASRLLGGGEDASLYGFACRLAQGKKKASPEIKKLLLDLCKSAFYAKATKPNPEPERQVPPCGDAWDCDKRTNGDWKIAVSSTIKDKEIDETLAKVVKLAEGITPENADVREVITKYVHPRFAAYAYLLLRYRALTEMNWRNLIVKQRWEAYIAQQRIDVYAGAKKESPELLDAEAQLYMALGHPSMHRHLERLRWVLDKNPYSRARANPESVNQLEDLDKARTQMAKIESDTAVQLGEYLPALKVALKSTPPKWAGSGRIYPRYIYWNGPAISDYKKWLKEHAPRDLKSGEYIVLVERFAPDREEYPLEPDLPPGAAKEDK